MQDVKNAAHGLRFLLAIGYWLLVNAITSCAMSLAESGSARVKMFVCKSCKAISS